VKQIEAKDRGLVLAVVVLLGLVLACGVPACAEEDLKQEDKTALTTDHEAVAEAGDDMDLAVVEQEPPEDQTEEVDEAAKPSATAVWIPGYWRWDKAAKQYVWVGGLWREPPPGLVWHPGHWKKTASGWAWIAGHWGKPGEKDLVIVKSAPPPVKVETKPAQPGPGYVWASGHWRWNGTKYVWVSGTWQKPATSKAVWVKGHYVRRPGGYTYVPGHWDHAPRARVVVPPKAKRIAPRLKPPKRPRPLPPRRPLRRPPRRR